MSKYPLASTSKRTAVRKAEPRAVVLAQTTWLLHC